jgi:hypothetical protein
LGPGFFPIRPGHFFAPVHAPAPVFVHAPVAVNRPSGPFVIFGHPGFQTIVPVTAAPATTTAPAAEAPTTAAPATTAAPIPVAPVPTAPANYNFEYGVSDATSGVNLGHSENRNGNNSIFN